MAIPVADEIPKASTPVHYFIEPTSDPFDFCVIKHSRQDNFGYLPVRFFDFIVLEIDQTMT